jgi:hypothetical protein
VRITGPWLVPITAVLLASACQSAAEPSAGASSSSTPQARQSSATHRPEPAERPVHMRLVAEGQHPLNSRVPRAGTPLVSGQYFGQIRTIDLEHRRLTFDVQQWLSGEAANEAAAAAGEIEPGDGVPNDYYIRNVSKAVRTLRLASHVTVTVSRCQGACGQYLGSIRGLAQSFQDNVRNADLAAPYRGADSIYWITLRSGLVTRIDEQYTP